jgi:outer membrane protein OmpA-like peptidoglycan-associated protein
MADIKASTLSLKKGLLFGSGNFYQINLNRTNVYVLEIEDIFFKLDSAVMMPDSVEDNTQTDKEKRITGIAVLKTVFLRLLEHPEQKMLIAGHTDTSGKESYNYELSELRAESVTCLL